MRPDSLQDVRKIAKISYGAKDILFTWTLGFGVRSVLGEYVRIVLGKNTYCIGWDRLPYSFQRLADKGIFFMNVSQDHAVFCTANNSKEESAKTWRMSNKLTAVASANTQFNPLICGLHWMEIAYMESEIFCKMIKKISSRTFPLSQ
jgi:hypothetical protein